MRRYSRLCDVWDTGEDNNDDFDTFLPSKKKDFGPFVTRQGVHSAFVPDKPSTIEGSSVSQPSVQTGNNDMLSFALLQELRDRDRRLEMEIQKRQQIELELQGCKNKNCSNTCSQNNCSTNNKIWIWIIPLAILLVIFSVWLFLTLDKLNKKIDRFSFPRPNNVIPIIPSNSHFVSNYELPNI